MVNVLKISNTSCLSKIPRQTRQTQIRLLLKKQSDQGPPCLLFWQAFVNSSPENQHFVWESKKKIVGNFRTFTVSWCLFQDIINQMSELSMLWTDVQSEFLGKIQRNWMLKQLIIKVKHCDLNFMFSDFVLYHQHAYQTIQCWTSGWIIKTIPPGWE